MVYYVIESFVSPIVRIYIDCSILSQRSEHYYWRLDTRRISETAYKRTTHSLLLVVVVVVHINSLRSPWSHKKVLEP